MAVNKVIYGNTTLVDLTSDTVTADNMAAGVRATGADGTKIVGLLPKVAIDNELSSTSTNVVQNKAVYAAVNKKLDKTGIAAYATRDSSGNVIINTYATKTDLNSYVKSINNVKPDSDGNVTISVGGGSGNYTLPTASSSTLGGVKIGSGLTINTSGVVSADVTSSTLTAYAKTTDLSAVATSGSYNDLSNKPTIPSAYTLPNATSSTLGGVKVGSNISVAGGTISITKSNVTSALGYTPPTTNTDTHWTTGLKVGASATATANAAATNGNVFLNVLDNTTVRDFHNIVGSGATTVTSDANGKITISSTNTVYTHPTTHPASMITGLATVATSGSYNDLTNKPTIPAAYSLPDATASVKGGVKIGSNLTVSSGTISLTKANVTSALGYTPPASDTTYGDATTTSSGLMSSTDKVKLNGIANNANYYIHPPTHPASMISGLATVATSGSYNDLTDKPSNATTSSAGLMSAADKSKLDGISSDAGNVKMIVYS